mmetsp:Transcript_15055/g.46843  ORF Transcript_15055/g.46843 Transcript_15055/m.46843 type:complete len:248 (-) Transcript_15055:55-798(-)
MLGLLQGAVHRLDDGRLLVDAVEVCIEHRHADDVQRHAQVTLLHVRLHSAGAATGGRLSVQLVRQALGAGGELVRHVVEPRLVKAWQQCAAAHLPRVVVGGDEPFTHDFLEDLRQQPLAVPRGVVPQDVPHHPRVGHHHEALGAEDQVVHAAVLAEVRVQLEQQRPVAQQVQHAPLDQLGARGLEVLAEPAEDHRRHADGERVEHLEGAGDIRAGQGGVAARRRVRPRQVAVLARRGFRAGRGVGLR